MSRDAEEQDATTPIILRSIQSLGDQPRKMGNSIISRKAGYSAEQVARLTDEHRLGCVDFLHLTLPVIEREIDRLKPLCPAYQAPPATAIIRWHTRVVFFSSRFHLYYLNF